MDHTPDSPTPVRGEFPIGVGTVILCFVAGLGIYSTIADFTFHSQADPLVVKTIEEAVSVEKNKFVEVDLPLDMKEAQRFQFGFSDDVHLIVPFEGTERKLVFVILVDPEKDDNEILTPPFQGRTVARDFDDTWNLGSARDVNLDKIVKGGLPAGAIVVRPEVESGISWWQWFITVLAVLFLLWVLFVLVMWLLGHDVLSDEVSTKACDSN